MAENLPGDRGAVALVLALVSVARPLFRPAAHAPGDPAPRHLIGLLHVTQAGPISVGGLAERLGVTLTTASLLVSELAELGLVTREEDPQDRRRTLVRAAADQRASCLLEHRLGPLERALAALAPDTRTALLGGLRELGAALAADRTEPVEHS